MSVMDGIETGPPEHDVNSQAGFDAILADRGIVAEEGEEPSADTSIASGLTTHEPSQGREPDGRFAPADTSAATGGDTSQGGDAPVVSSEDPEVQAFLDKYNGDATAAIKAAAGLTSVVGRQGQELGAERERIAKLEGMVEVLAQQRASDTNTSPLAALSSEQVEERSISLIEEKGYAAAATEAANIAHQSGDERLYKNVISQWQAEDSFSAVDFHADFRLWQRDQAAAAAAPAVEAPAWQAHAEQTALNDIITADIYALAAERPGFEAIAPHMDAALDQMPENVAAMIASTDPEARMIGLRIVADRATVLAGSATSSTPVTPPAPAPTTAQRKAAGAAVATGALRPPAKTSSAPQSKEEAIADFKKELMETETTSVASGLTYGKKPGE